MPLIAFIGFIDFILNINSEPTKQPIRRQHAVNFGKSRGSISEVEMQIIAEEMPLVAR
jgi:hypothetical protein